MNKKAPIGIDNFYKLVQHSNELLFVDKTFFIKDLIDSKNTLSLIIRPRRWGKTLNMSMIQHFFAPEVNGRPTKGIFDGLKIASINEGTYLEHQGKFSVLFITFKDAKQDTYQGFLNAVAGLIQTICSQYPELILSDALDEDEKMLFKKLRSKTASTEELCGALKTLSLFLHKHYNRTVFILIDEYDTPLNAAYGSPHFEELVNFFKIMFGSALKGNDALEKGIMTGILRLSKNKMLSDINHLKLYSLMEEQYSQYFGFSEQEVKQLLEESGLKIDLTELQFWYNGYRSGNATDIYNPWSILNCIDDKGLLKPYWIKTGDESLLRDIFNQASKSVEDKVVQLLEGNAIASTIDEYISFDQIQNGSEDVLWSLLWTTGYLKFKESPTMSPTGNYVGALMIPNYEVSCSFRAVFSKWTRAFNRNKYDSFLNDLITGDINAFVKDLEAYMLSIPSWFDFPAESNYHSFLLGLTASLQETHEVLSNKEVGLGRVDFLLTPKETNNNLAIIMEFKREEVGKDLQLYHVIAEEGLQQIANKKYAATLKPNLDIQQILNLCIVFYGKQFVYKHAVETNW